LEIEELIMTMYFANSTRGFYASDIHGDAIPADAVEISDDQYVALLDAQAQGKEIIGDVNGAPMATDPSTLLTVGQAQTAQISVLSAACQAAITAGFSSSALGTAHTYPSDTISQANLQQAASSPSGGLLWCMDSGGVWAFVAHTQAQAQQALVDFIARRNALQQQLATLTTAVNKAAMVSAVQAIIWTAPSAA
jgi:hypothetical protein